MVAERKPVRALLSVAGERERSALEASRARLLALGVLEGLEIGAALRRPANAAAAVAGSVEVFIPLPVDVDTAKLKDTLEKRAHKLAQTIDAGEKKLENPGYLQNADPETIEADRTRLLEMRQELELFHKNLAGF
jgi:valyl-tRNA synthetase